MSNPLPPTDSKSSQTRTHEHQTERTGATDRFTAKDITGKEPPQSHKVSKQNFRDPGGDFNHKFTIAKEIGWKTAFLFLLSCIFPFYSGPDLSQYVSKEPEKGEKPPVGEKESLSNPSSTDLETQDQLTLLGYQAEKKPIGSKEVQKLIKKAIPVDVGKLNKEWGKVQKKDRRAKVEFLEKVENHYKNTSSVDTETTAYLGEAKKATLKELDNLRQAVAKDILGDPVKKWRGHVDNLKQFPLHKDQNLIFNFYTKLEKEITALQTGELAYVPTLDGMKEEAEKSLISLQAEVKDILQEQIKQTKESLEKKMPLKELETLAKNQKPPVNLPKGTFQEKYAAFLKEVDSRVFKAQERVNNLDKKYSKLQQDERRKREVYETKQKERKEARLKLPELRDQRIQKALSEILDPWREEESGYVEKIKKAKSELQVSVERQNYLNDLKEGKIKKFIIKTVEFKEEDRKELETLSKSIEEQQKSIDRLEMTHQQRKKEVNTAKEEAIESAENWYREEDERLNPKKDTELPEYQAYDTARKELNTTLNSLTNARIELRDAEGLKHEAKRLLEKAYGFRNQLDTDFEAGVKRFAMLQHIQHAFTDFCKTDSSERQGVSPQSWVVEHKLSNSEVKNSLQSIFGYLPEMAKVTVEHVGGTGIIIRSPDHEATKSLGLQEFV